MKQMNHEQICSEIMQYLASVMIAISDIGEFLSGETTKEHLKERIDDFNTITEDAAKGATILALKDLLDSEDN